MLSKPLFQKIKPETLSKVVAVEGDISLPELGLSAENRQKLCSQVSVVIHAAATVKFTESLKTAFEVNVNGTRRMVDFCRGMTNLVVFVYVSTAYANCDQSCIDEIIYPMHIQLDEIENMNNATAETRTKELIGKRPNTYTFTKAMTECYLEKVSQDININIPICIVRPSVVTATWRDPFPGWTDSFGGLTSLLVMWGYRDNALSKNFQR